MPGRASSGTQISSADVALASLPDPGQLERELGGPSEHQSLLKGFTYRQKSYGRKFKYRNLG